MNIAVNSTRDLIDEIFAATNLDEAIFWREQLVVRLRVLIASRNLFDPQHREEVCLYASAKAQAEMAISRLQLARDLGETLVWDGGLPRFAVGQR